MAASLVLKIMKALNLSETIEDLLIMLTDQIHVVRLINPSTLLYLAVDKKQSNLAIARNAVSKHIGQIS